MEPGRELDAFIAEKVMGWKPWQSKHGYWTVTTHEGKELSTYGQRDYSIKYDPHTGEELRPVAWWEDMWDIPAFSTDIAAAWGVLERVKSWSYDNKRNFGIAICKHQNMAVGSYDYSYTNFVEDLCTVTPLAICLAAYEVMKQG